MMKEEFEKLVGKSVSNNDYEVIEKVYTWHPAIRECSGKEQIARLYNEFGMSVIRGMVAVVEHMIKLEEERLELKRRREWLNVRTKRLEEGDTRLEDMIARVNDLFAKSDKAEIFDAAIEELKEKEERELVELAMEIAGL